MAAGDLTATVGLVNEHGAYFDGVDDIISGDISFDLSKGISVVADAKFINATTTTDKTIFSIGVDGTKLINCRIIKYVPADQASQGVRIGGAGWTDNFSSGNANEIETDTWYNCVWVWDTTTFKTYRNGVLDVSELSNLDTWNGSANSFEISKPLSGGTYMNGLIKNVKLYSRILSQTEITNIYNGKHIKDGLIGHWKLKSDANDSVGSADGTVDGAVFAGQLLTTDIPLAVNDMNLAAATDKLICVPIEGRDGKVSIFGAERE